jgi:putative endonuclease
MDARQRLGRAAEQVAADYLEEAGYRILARNARVGRGELDIVARRGGALVFVEVKARRTRACGSPEDAVTPLKQRQVGRLAERWLAGRPGLQRAVNEVRFDVIAVDLTVAPPRVRHLPAAFYGQG